MALSLLTPSSSLLSPFQIQSLIPTFLSQTAEIPKFSLIASIPPANFPPRAIRCDDGADSSGEIAESSSSSASVSSVFVKGLPLSVSEGRLRKVFSEFGEVSNVKIMIKKRTRQSLGYGYVWFTREEQAESALEAMNGKVYA